VPIKLPTHEQLMNPLLRALRALGGSGSIEEIYDKVVELEQFPDEIVSQPHDPERSNRTEVEYRLAWARTYLKKYGVLENSSRGIWALTAKAKDLKTLNTPDVVRTVRALDKKDQDGGSEEVDAPREVSLEQGWKQELHGLLTKVLSPAAFER
jgi:restriction system protein